MLAFQITNKREMREMVDIQHVVGLILFAFIMNSYGNMKYQEGIRKGHLEGVKLLIHMFLKRKVIQCDGYGNLCKLLDNGCSGETIISHDEFEKSKCDLTIN